MVNHTENEKVVKIANPERVERILSRVFNAQLEVLIRAPKNMAVAVRGKAYAFDMSPTGQNLVISDISERGHRYLSFENELRIEFVGMSTQIVFHTRKVAMDPRGLTVTRPRELLSYDRRENARVQITSKHASFIQLSLWNPGVADLTAPPIIPMFESLASYILLADISEGGVCGVTRFPGVLDAIDRGSKDTNALLILPMHQPIGLPIEVRWARRIKESRLINDEARHQRFFRIGIQFQTLDESQKLTIKQYMQQLSVASAI